MKFLISLIMALILLFAASAQADIATDKQNAYKKANLSFQLSDTCKTAINTLKTEVKSDLQNITTACTQEAATANCGTAQAGKGLLKCIRAYKKTNRSFQLSTGCKAAISV